MFASNGECLLCGLTENLRLFIASSFPLRVSACISDSVVCSMSWIEEENKKTKEFAVFGSERRQLFGSEGEEPLFSRTFLCV